MPLAQSHARAREAAERLLAARRARRPLAALPEDLRPRDLAAGYRIQAAMLESLGGRPAGFKIAATSRRAQELLGIGGPFYGCLLPDAVHDSPAELSAGRFMFRLIEPEFALRLGAALPPRRARYRREEAADAVASVHPAFEVVTSAFGPAWTAAGAPALAADNAVHGALVLGPATEDWRGLDLARQEVVFACNGREVGRGRGANALGHPLDALAWLADAAPLAERGLAAGDLVTTGVVTPFLYAEAGDRLEAAFGPFGGVLLALVG